MQLTLPEQLLLLLLHDEKGKVVSAASLAADFALDGALLLELHQQGLITVDDEHVRLVPGAASDDPVLARALTSIQAQTKTRKLAWWVSRPGKLHPKLRRRLQHRLAERGILREEEHHFLWLIPYSRFPEENPSPEDDLRAQLYRIVFEGDTPDERAAILLNLIHACDLAKEVFPDADRKATKKWLKEFAEGDAVAKAVTDQVTAILVSVIITSVTTSIVAASSN